MIPGETKSSFLRQKMLISRESTCASPLFDRSLRITEIREQKDYGSSRNPDDETF